LPICFQREDYPLYLGRLLTELEGKAILETHDFDHRNDYSLADSYAGVARTALAA